MPGAPGMPGTPGTGGSTIIQNFNINIGEQPPKGFSLATGSDGKPVEPKTVIGPDGKPITTVEAKDANGNPVVLEQTIGMDGKPVVTTILKDSNGQEIRTPVAPENLQPIEGIIDFTKIDIDDILTNPRRGENFKVYNKILSEAMKDPQTRDKLKIISDIESERAVLKFFAQSKKEKHMAEAQSLQKQMLEAKAKQDEQLRKEALERAKLAESEREEMERLSKENQALYIKVFGMTPSDQRGQLVENMASIAKEHNVGSDSVPTAPTQMPAVTTAPMPAGMPQMPVMPTNPQLNAAALPVVPTFAAPTLPQGLPQLPTARGATMSASPTPATTTPAAALPPGFKAPTFTMPTPPAFSAPNLPTFAPPQLPTNLPKL
ncbi:MAG: hypothetical protein KBD31_05700, partial [Proteobacteria bacterium]|nr:hypothetical protein [Pseudomonadota bacterium]